MTTTTHADAGAHTQSGPSPSKRVGFVVAGYHPNAQSAFTLAA